jgi:hypothetical protein
MVIAHAQKEPAAMRAWSRRTAIMSMMTTPARLSETRGDNANRSDRLMAILPPA